MIGIKYFKHNKLLVSFLGFIMIFSCLAVFTVPVAADGPVALTVTGDGVDKTVEFTLAELESLPQAAYTYSGYNHWPSLQVFKDMQGPTLKTILDLAGLKDNATLIRVKLNEDVYSEFTKAQLLDEPRYYFPDGEKDEEELAKWPPVRSEKGKKAVETMIALNEGHGKLIFGQCAVNEPTCCQNRMLSGLCQGGIIEVLTEPLEQWEAPQADVPSGVVAAGTEVTVQHRDGTPYHALVYYTLDGSEPGYGSSLANISYPSFQPHLNQAIPVNENLIIKTKTIGMGKLDSEVATYQYTIETPGLAPAGGTQENAGTDAEIAAPAITNQFVDLENHPAKDDINILVAKGLINGVTATEFKPEDNLTRAQIAKILTVALNIVPDNDAGISFTDTAPEAWYYDYVNAAVQAGLITGYGNNTFAPDEKVNREQLAVMIARAIKMKSDAELSGGNVDEIISRFSDKEEISAWAYEDIALIVSCNIVNENDSVFAPQTPATRAQASLMIRRMCSCLGMF